MSESWIWAVAIAIHGLFWLSLRYYWLCPLYNDTVHRFGPGADFFALYQAGWSATHAESIYQFVPGHTVIPYAYPFRYLPVGAYTVGSLLTLVSPSAAYALWLGLCELCMIHNVRETYRRAGRGRRGALLASVWLAFSPFFLELWVGQFTFLLGTLLFLSALSMEDGDPGRAQAWWTTSVLWKPASLLWVPIWARDRRHWRGVAVCMVLLAANLVYFHYFPADWKVFADTNLNPTPTWHAGNLGLSGLIFQFTRRTPYFLPVRYVFHVLVLLPALWVTFRPCLRKMEERVDPPFWLLAAVWTCSYFLIYKDVWEHHLTLLLPFMVLGLLHRPSRLLAVIVALLALPSPFVFYDIPKLGFNVDPQPYFPLWISILHHSWRVVPLVVLYVLWLRMAGRPGELKPVTAAA